MTALTVEDWLRNAWLASSTLSRLVPFDRVFIGIPTTQQNELTPTVYPLATIRSAGVLKSVRTNELNAETVLVRVSVLSQSRQEAIEISNAAYDAWKNQSGTLQRGSLLDIKPQSMTEAQESDGAWVVSWLYRALYTV